MKVEVDNLQRSYDKRQTHNPNTPDKLPTDHAGHLIADIFGGSPELDNLVSMDAFINQSTYRKLENKWDRALKSNPLKKVEIQIFLDYSFVPASTAVSGGIMRPTQFRIESTIDGQMQSVVKISNASTRNK